MKLKHFISENPIGKAVLFGLGFMSLAVILLIIELLFSYTAVNRAVDQIKTDSTSNSPQIINWEVADIQHLWKEKFWIENQIAMARDDSMSLGINIKDSLIQLQFKGLPLIKSKIVHAFPKEFLSDLDAKAYFDFFGHPMVIVTSQANIVKRPFKRMKVNSEGNTQAVDSAVLLRKPFAWSFVTDNNLRFVIYGSDSAGLVPSFRRDVLKFRIAEKTKGLFGDYTPTLFIWVNDKEAEAIYRALPHKTTLIIRN